MAWKFSGLAAIGLVFATLANAGSAQVTPTLTESERGIKDVDAEAAKHLRIDELRVAARIVGRTADVTVEVAIASDSADSYEANLALALPADAVVTGYALSVGNAMISGVLLESPKARNLYEAEVRKGIDPGLGEVSPGNRFATRVFPITRDTPRRVRVTLAAPFDPSRGLVLPLMRNVAPARVALDVTIDGYAAVPSVSFAGATVALERSGAGWRGTAVATGPLRAGLTVAGGNASSPMAVVRHANGERFFVIDDGAALSGARLSPGRLRIYWDRSLSHGRGDPAAEAKILERLVSKMAPTGIDLVTFASDRPTIVPVMDAAGLRRALAAVVYRGATSLAGLDALPLPPAGKCVLVTDGQITIDRSATFVPGCPVSVLTASGDADGARLSRIAQQNGGTFVRALASAAPEAADALLRGAVVSGVRDSKGARVAYRALPATDGRWLLVGRVPASGGLRVQLRDGSVRSYADGGSAIAVDAPAALWASTEVQALADDPRRHEEMATFARRYRVAGPAMSLLVLETPDQYIRAGIAPPAGFDADWMKDYRDAKKEADGDATDKRRERLEFVLDEWRKRKNWSTQRFVVKSKAAAERDATNVVPPPPPAAPLPSPVTPPASSVAAEPLASRGRTSGADDADSATADIVLTGTLRRVPPLVEAPRPADAEIKLDLADLIAKRPYIAALNAAAPSARLAVLGSQEREYGSLPSFYLDTAEWFRLKGDRATADLLLMSALELPLTDDETRQIVAFRLERDKLWNRSIELSETLAAANDRYRPQPARDLALVLAARGRSRGVAGRADLERAFSLLTEAALNPASSDYDGFEVIALMEANALIPDLRAVKGRWELDPRLVGVIDTDVRIVIEWTADDADIDLWVDEPNGERVYYGNKLSSAGGQISNDMTDGYGPEEYLLRRAPVGAYRVRVNGYDADRLNPNGPGHVLIRLVRNFARRSEVGELADVDLSFQKGGNRDNDDETKPVATLLVKR